MFRLTTPDGLRIEVDNLKDFTAAVELLHAQRVVRNDAGSLPRSTERQESQSASPRAVHGLQDVITRFARTDGQRRLLEALVAAVGLRSDDQLAKALGMTKFQMLGTLGAIYSNALAQKLDADQIVRREEYRTPTGRRAYRYAPGPLLRGAH